jgi:hypothetical protein
VSGLALSLGVWRGTEQGMRGAIVGDYSSTANKTIVENPLWIAAGRIVLLNYTLS